MAISLETLRSEFTKTLVDVYQQKPNVTTFGRSLFKTTTSPTKYVSIEVERQGEPLAVDVLRGTEGNRNTFSRTTEKVYYPPFWREYFDATELDLYDRVLGAQGNANAPLFAALMNTVADRLSSLRNKIERSKEKQCWDALLTGIITMNQGDNIDFKRKAASLVDLSGAGGYFAANSDVFAQFAAAGTFLRTVGKVGDGTFNAIFGETALQDFLKNTVFLGRQDLTSMQLDAVTAVVRNQNGAAYHGTITAGAYRFNLWSYPQFYDLSNGTSTAYVDPKKVIVIPTAPRFNMAHAAVPQLIGQPGQLPTQGEYVIGEYMDERNASHIFDIKSAAVAIPVAIDTIYTMKAVTG